MTLGVLIADLPLIVALLCYLKYTLSLDISSLQPAFVGFGLYYVRLHRINAWNSPLYWSILLPHS